MDSSRNSGGDATCYIPVAGPIWDNLCNTGEVTRELLQQHISSRGKSLDFPGGSFAKR